MFAWNVIVKNEHLNVISQGRDCVKKRGGCGDPGNVRSSDRVFPVLLSPEFLGARRVHTQAVLCRELIPRSGAVGRAREKEQPEGTNSVSLQEQGGLSGSDLKPAAADSCGMDYSQLCPQSGGRDNRLAGCHRPQALPFPSSASPHSSDLYTLPGCQADLRY